MTTGYSNPKPGPATVTVPGIGTLTVIKASCDWCRRAATVIFSPKETSLICLDCCRALAALGKPPQPAYRECMDIRCMVDTPHDEH